MVCDGALCCLHWDKDDVCYSDDDSDEHLYFISYPPHKHTVEVRRFVWAGPSQAAEGRKYDQTLISEALPWRRLNVLIGGEGRRTL